MFLLSPGLVLALELQWGHYFSESICFEAERLSFVVGKSDWWNFMDLLFEDRRNFHISAIVVSTRSEIFSCVRNTTKVIAGWRNYLLFTLPVFGRKGDRALEMIVLMSIWFELGTLIMWIVLEIFIKFLVFLLDSFQSSEPLLFNLLNSGVDFFFIFSSLKLLSFFCFFDAHHEKLSFSFNIFLFLDERWGFFIVIDLLLKIGDLFVVLKVFFYGW